MIKNSKGKRPIHLQRPAIQLTSATLKSWKTWNNNILQVLKVNNYQPKELQRAKLSFRNDREMRIFQDKNKLRQFMTTQSAQSQNHNSTEKNKFPNSKYMNKKLERKPSHPTH